MSICGLLVIGGFASAHSCGYATENPVGVLRLAGDAASDDAGVDEFVNAVVELPGEDVVQVFEGDSDNDRGGFHHEEAVQDERLHGRRPPIPGPRLLHPSRRESIPLLSSSGDNFHLHGSSRRCGHSEHPGIHLEEIRR